MIIGDNSNRKLITGGWMPISNFEGNTFVAFLDISGFKELMQREEKAWTALDKFYQNGYEILRHQDTGCRVDGIFISDSGILFVRGNDKSDSDRLLSLLKKIGKINENMLEQNLMLTTSIAYGKFKYQERIEFEGIGKTPIYGDAYVSAFLDNENGHPKIQPGQCRIVKKNLPSDTLMVNNQTSSERVFSLIKPRMNDDNHLYFYWMVNSSEAIDGFEKNYKDSYTLKYSGMLKALSGNH